MVTSSTPESPSPREHIRRLLGWLGDSENQLSLAVEAAELGIWHWSPDTGEIYWSDRCRQLLGVADDLAPSLDAFYGCVHPEDRSSVHEAIGEALGTGCPYSIEFRVQLPEGRIRWVHSLGRLARPVSAGAFARMSGVLRDITQAREAEAALARQRLFEEQAQLWSSVFTHSKAGVSIVDPRGCTIRSVNTAYTQLSGYAPAELVGRSARSLYAPDQADILLATATRSDAEGSASSEIVRLHKDGMRIPTRVDMVSIAGADGTVQYRIVTITDLREHVRIQAELRHHAAIHDMDQRFRLLAESAPIGIVLADPEGAVTYANPAWLAITAIPLGQALNMDWFDLVHPDDRERVVSAWERTREGGAFDLEFRYLRPSGEARWVQAHASELKDDTGQSLGFVRTSLDVTDRLLERAATDRFHSQVRALSQRLQEMREIERNEIGGSLQDTVYQGLSELHTQAMIRNDRAPKGSVEAKLSARMVSQAQATLEALRKVLFDLTPPGIAELGFSAALERYVAEHSAQAGCSIHLSLPPEPLGVHQQTLAILYSVAQEAIGNALEHARAQSMDVSLEIMGNTVRLRVSDDGIGIGDKDRMKHGCFGLLAASERLAQLGGTLRVMGVAGSGTVLEASVPWRKTPRH